MLEYNMANFIYKKAKEGMLNGQIDIDSTNLKVVFIDTSKYSANEDINQFLSDIPSNARVHTSLALGNVSTTLGVLDADDMAMTYDGLSFQAIVLCQTGSTDENSRLISFIDTSEGLPFAQTSESVSLLIRWDNTSTKIITI